MTLSEKILKLNYIDFKQIIDVKREPFYEMIEILQLAYREKHKNRGRHTKLNIEEQLLMSLKYWRQLCYSKRIVF